jgi:hypothetical protein
MDVFLLDLLKGKDLGWLVPPEPDSVSLTKRTKKNQRTCVEHGRPLYYPERLAFNHVKLEELDQPWEMCYLTTLDSSS